ncbi:MAG: hypothetical protein IPN18_16240 [Ignavibacteriales bacterium]|nr:hypothetical protein [Ignavibacteriales bacterium]
MTDTLITIDSLPPAKYFCGILAQNSGGVEISDNFINRLILTSPTGL